MPPGIIRGILSSRLSEAGAGTTGARPRLKSGFDQALVVAGFAAGAAARTGATVGFTAPFDTM